VTHRPGDATALAALVRDARASARALRFEGAAAWSGAGTPAARVARDATAVSLSAMTGVVSYVPNDLTLTVRAGTTLAELDAITAANHQWCPLLPWGNDAGTIGATFATATAGPCSATLGRPRDVALGVEFVDGTGTLIRGGGHVVKNVAGFDLTRLIVGSFGSLGAITEVTVRLRARPAADVTWLVAATGPRAAERLAGIRRGTVTPFACELLTPAAAHTLGVAEQSALVRFGGNAALIAAALSDVSSIGTVSELDPEVWTRYRAVDPHPRSLAARPLAGSIARRIKERFDPAAIMNRGVFGECE